MTSPPPDGPGAPDGRVPNYLTAAVLTTVFACTPFGLLALVFALRVNKALAVGDRSAAITASQRAWAWSWVAAVTGVIAYLACFVALAVLLPRLWEQLRAMNP